jgi:hypothetical protein
LSAGERSDVLRAAAGISAAAGRLLRELLDNSLTPEDAMTLGNTLSDAGWELRRYGRRHQEALQGKDGHAATPT